MKKTNVIVSLIGTLILGFSAQASAIGLVKLDPKSPLLDNLNTIAAIYEQSCLVGSDNSFSSNNFPMYEEDKLSDKFKQEYMSPKFKMWYAIHGITVAGYEIGRTLTLTDLSGDDIENQCKDYSKNFATVVVNNPANWKGSSTNPPQTSPSATPPTFIFNSPFNDIFAPREHNQIDVTPRIAQQNGCRYMYITLAQHPVIDISPLDATLDVMENMLWHDYKRNVIRSAYSFLLAGTKEGQYLFNSKQDVKSCYE